MLESLFLPRFYPNHENKILCQRVFLKNTKTIFQIVYSEGNRFQVRVYMEKRTPETIGERGVTTNVIYLTFETENEVPRIYPRSYGEAMLLVDGKRHFDNSI